MRRERSNVSGSWGSGSSPAQEKAQAARVAAFRRRRPAEPAARALDTLRRETAAGRNVMGPLLAALRAGVTLGEVAGLWRELFGEHTPSRAF